MPWPEPVAMVQRAVAGLIRGAQVAIGYYGGAVTAAELHFVAR